MISAQNHLQPLSGNNMLKNRLRLLVFTYLLALGNLHLAAQTAKNKAVLMLPFCSKLTLANPNHSDFQLSELSREYYQGLLVAMDSLERLNIAIDLTVLDTENDSTMVAKLLKKQAMKDAQLIIGPVLKAGNKMLANFVKDKEIIHVSPLMTFVKPELADANTIAANPYLSSYGKLIGDFIQSGLVKDSVVVFIVSDKSTLDKNVTAGIKQTLNKTIKIRTIEAEKIGDIEGLLSNQFMNHIIIPTNSEKVVNNFLKAIKDTTHFRNIKLYGFPQWFEFKNVSYNQLQQANVRIATPFFIDYSDLCVHSFIQAYRDRFFTEPTEAAFKGYDQALLLLTQLNQHGKKMIAKIEEEPQPTFHTMFNFKRIPDNGGYENYYLNFIGIQDLKYLKLNK